MKRLVSILNCWQEWVYHSGLVCSNSQQYMNILFNFSNKVCLSRIVYIVQTILLVTPTSPAPVVVLSEKRTGSRNPLLWLRDRVLLCGLWRGGLFKHTNIINTKHQLNDSMVFKPSATVQLTSSHSTWLYYVSLLSRKVFSINTVNLLRTNAR